MTALALSCRSLRAGRGWSRGASRVAALLRHGAAQRRLAALDPRAAPVQAADDPQAPPALGAAACGLGLGCATALTLSAFQDNLVFFLLALRPARQGAAARAAPSASAGWSRQAACSATTDDGQPGGAFRVTDGARQRSTVTYIGILPDLFREGQGVVTLGTLRPDGIFRASEVLAKHDETYMPQDVADALKRTGHWNPGRARRRRPPTWNTLRPGKRRRRNGAAHDPRTRPFRPRPRRRARRRAGGAAAGRRAAGATRG